MGREHPARPRRSCLTVPGSSPKMLAKAAELPADEIILDLEDSVAPPAKDEARANVVRVLAGGDWPGKTMAVRVNGVATRWCYRDLIDVVTGAGPRIDCVVLPKTEAAADVCFVASLLRMVEDSTGLARPIGIEAQIESAAGLQAIGEIAAASPRLEALVFGPGDMAASLGMPSTSIGEIPAGYPGDPWHWVLGTILAAARAAGLQAIDGPFGRIRDLSGFRSSAVRAYTLGYDGKWVLHPSQVGIANEVFTPGQEEFERAQDILDAYGLAGREQGLGAVAWGADMIDEASRKMAERLAVRGRAAGLAGRQGRAGLASGRGEPGSPAPGRGGDPQRSGLVATGHPRPGADADRVPGVDGDDEADQGRDLGL
jgi:citrate lyase subunit beta / citryl-CoA lyase